MSRAHLVPLALAFLTGIVAEGNGAAAPLLLFGTVVAIAFPRVPRSVRALVVTALALGALDAHFFARPVTPAGDRRSARVAATLVEARVQTGERYEATVRLQDGALALVSLPLPVAPIGSRFALRAKREPFDDPRNPGEPSMRELEAERGISWHLARAHLLASDDVVDVGDATLWMPRLRAWASAQLHAELGEPDATILAGTLWGERGALAPDLRAEFQDTGTVHVLVTAGLHLGVVAALALAILRFAGCGRISSSLATIAMLWAYAAFSGAHLPSLRAATMLSFALLARAAGRSAYSWNGLAAAAIVVAALRPASVGSLSFALSFSCVAAIFAFARPLAAACERVGMPEFVCELGGVALATQLGTWPLTASAFLVIAPYAPIANAAVVPVVGVAMLAGFAELVLAPIPLGAHLVANIERSLLDWILGSVRFVAGLPFAHIVATPPPPWTLVVYDAALIAAAYAAHRARPAIAASLVLAASALCLWPPRAPAAPLAITEIDVGQADALLIRTPRGHAFLVDAGGRLERGASSDGTSAAEDVGTRVVVPFLIRNGIHHLDAVLLSHPHGDHAGGVAPVLRTLGADTFADTGQSYSGFAYRDALSVVRERRTVLVYPRAGTVWRSEDGVTLTFLGPSLPFITGSRNDINTNSLVFVLQYRTFRMLFTGDAGSETEQRMLRAGADLRADILLWELYLSDQNSKNRKKIML